jgi:hypothetical protein
MLRRSEAVADAINLNELGCFRSLKVNRMGLFVNSLRVELTPS